MKYIIHSVCNHYYCIEELIEYLHNKCSQLDLYTRELLVFPVFKTTNTGALLNAELWFYEHIDYF